MPTKTKQSEKNKKEALEIINTAIEAYQKRTGTTREMLAEAMGMGQGAVTQYLTNKIPLNTDFLIQLSALFKELDSQLSESVLKIIRQPKAYTLPLKYTLSGTQPEKEAILVNTLVESSECYGVLVDIQNAIQPQNSVCIVNPSIVTHNKDIVIVKRKGKSEAILGTLENHRNEWAVLVPSWGQPTMVPLKPTDKVDRVVGQYFPRGSRKKFSPQMLNKSN